MKQSNKLSFRLSPLRFGAAIAAGVATLPWTSLAQAPKSESASVSWTADPVILSRLGAAAAVCALGIVLYCAWRASKMAVETKIEKIKVDLKNIYKEHEYQKDEMCRIEKNFGGFAKNGEITEILEIIENINCDIRAINIVGADTLASRLTDIETKFYEYAANLTEKSRVLEESDLALKNSIENIPATLVDLRRRLDELEARPSEATVDPKKPKMLRPDQVDHLAQILGTMNGDSRRKLLVIPHDDVHLLLALVHDVGFSDGMSESQAKTIEEWLRQIAAERRIRLIQPRLNGRYVEFEQAVVERRADDGGGVSHRVVEVKKFGLAVDNVIIRPAEVVVAI